MKNSDENRMSLYEIIVDFVKGQNTITADSLMDVFDIGFIKCEEIIEQLLVDKVIKKHDGFYNVIRKIDSLKIYLLDSNKEMVEAWKKEFLDCLDVEIVNDSFENFMNVYNPECVVSPGNSYGSLSGGYDLAILNYFGYSLQLKIQKFIKENYLGEQPIATSFIVKTKGDKKVIHTPTMRLPSKIKDSHIIYQSMRTTLLVALKNKIKTIVIPAFGAGCGKADCEIVAKMMKEGFAQISKNL